MCYLDLLTNILQLMLQHLTFCVEMTKISSCFINFCALRMSESVRFPAVSEVVESRDHFHGL